MANRNAINGACSVKLTQALLSRIEPTGKRFDIRDTGVKGFLLRVGAKGSLTWAFDYRDQGGKREKVTIGPSTRWTQDRARKAARKLSGQVASGHSPAAELREERAASNRRALAAKAWTIRILLDGDYWHLHLSSRRTGEATQKRIKYAWSPFLDRDIQSVTAKELANHRARRLSDGITAQTLNRDRTAVFTLFNFALEHGLIEVNPLMSKIMKPLELEDDKRVRWLGQRDSQENYEIGERGRFLMALKNQPPLIRSIVGLAMNTGLRRGEIFGLIWDRIDLNEKQLTVDAANAKTAKTRHAPLNKTAVEFLRQWKLHQGNVRYIGGLVFPSPVTGNKLIDIKRGWSKLVEEAEVIDFRFHDLRHDFASQLVKAKIPLYEVKELLGHSSIDLTERYAHLDDAQLLNAVEALD